ncbi:nitroreductase family protein [Marinicrinis lubricantis]|uniref:Nitroreductase family protein n=1 Tax=Marinicrinis lubricantis TaxID=2086470 RepID=A0ABW1IQ45_9BACL
MNDFTQVIKERRSANKFMTGIEIADHELNDIFELVKFAPSAYNLQHAHYIVVRDAGMKQKIYEAANKQYKVLSASAAIIVLGHKDAHMDAAWINEGQLNLGIMNQQEYDHAVASTIAFYEERGENFKHEEAVRNASLSAMLFMLAAKHKGWDTCPMIGFDPEQICEVLNIPDRYVPALLITLGKEDVSSQRLRGYRKPVGEFVTFDSF